MKLNYSKIVLMFFSLFVIIVNAQTYKKLQDGLMFDFKKTNDTDAKLVKIQVCSDEIIRVIASPSESLSKRQSLMVNKASWPNVKWNLKENGNDVEISTSKLIVRVNKIDGSVSFFDLSGTVITKEISKGRIISSADVFGEKTYHIQQYFNSPDNEAFYGLGAHQNNVWNYKGHDVDLYQYNIVDVIPFLISSKNYGILWDNNSRTKFGDTRDYQQITQLKLFNKDGVESGLSSEYFQDENFQTIFTSRNENRISHEYLDVNDEFPEGFQKNVKAVRWNGEISSAESGVHKFQLFCSGFTKMWFNGELVVDSWRQNWLPWTNNINLNMEAGKRYQIKIEWIHSGGYIGLKYLSPEKNIIANSISLYSEVADQIDYYFIHGENTDQVIKGYREITGKAPMMPKWAMGLWQCRERYKTQDELVGVVKEFRKRKIPFDNIVQDWFYWKENDWGSHDFDLTRYPDPDLMVKTLHDTLNAHIMISVWTKFYVGLKHYNDFLKNGWLYMRNVEKGQKDWVGPGYVSTFYDPYSEGARKLYWKQINEKLFSKGFDAWWLDSTEPDLQSDLSIEETRLRIGPTALGSSSRYLNTYSLMNCKAVYEGQRKTNPNLRVFILTRSVFAGQQRYSAATWSGDIATRWYDLKAQIPAGLNFSIAGVPYWTTDIGGFAVEPRFEKPNDADLEEWRELNTRWFQFGTFCPLLRVHGQFPFREMFNVAPDNHPAYQTMLAYDKLRYRLMPYIYSLTGMVTQQDYTIMRALIMDFASDKNVVNIGNQFMFGPSLLINPVTEYKARNRNVYLPATTNWYDFKSGKYFAGGQSIVADAPYSDIPIFVKEGSIIPCGPEIQFASEKTSGPIRLFIYTGQDGSFTLYEDEDVNYNYEKGKFSLIKFDYNEKNQSLKISKRKGEFDGMQKKRTFDIVWISKNKPKGLDIAIIPDATAEYNGNELIIKR